MCKRNTLYPQDALDGETHCATRRMGRPRDVGYNRFCPERMKMLVSEVWQPVCQRHDVWSVNRAVHLRLVKLIDCHAYLDTYVANLLLNVCFFVCWHSFSLRAQARRQRSSKAEISSPTHMCILAARTQL